MSQPYISIILRQEQEQGPVVTMTLGQGINLTALAEPGAVLQRFLNARECYVMQSRPEGHYFSYASSLNGEPYMLTLLVDNGFSLAGDKILALFGSLNRVFHQQGSLSQEDAKSCLQRADVPAEGVKLASWDYIPCQHSEEAAYRTYMALRELEAIFSFPAQPDYEPYCCILVVQATTSLRPGIRMHRITSPIRKQYSVVCPPGVEASKSMVYDGDRLTLTYSEPGFDSHKESMIVGQSVVYARPEGSTLMVRDAKDCGIVFIKRIPVRVVMSNGSSVMGYTLQVNGRNADTRDGYIELTENDLRSGQPVDIVVTSSNCKPLDLKQDPDKLPQGELLLTLEPMEQVVKLEMDFGQGRVIEVKTAIEKNSAEYTRLRAGRFHGYRANLQANHGLEGEEIYRLDLRNADKVETSQSADPNPDNHELEAPKFENIAAGPDDAPVGSTRWVHDQVEEAVEEDANSNKRPPYLKWMLYGVGVVFIVVLIAFLIPEGETTETVAENSEQLVANGAERQTTPSAPNSDYSYFDTTNQWDKGKITTAQGRQLIQAMEMGDIDAVVHDPYFKGGKCKNTKANDAVTLLWKAKNSPSQAGNIKKLKAAAQANPVDWDKLYDKLVLARPNDNDANPAPRP